MNNKIGTNIFLPTIEFKNKINKRNRNRIIDTENILMVVRWEGGHVDRLKKKVKGLRSTNW